jgi:hypothetical protein
MYPEGSMSTFLSGCLNAKTEAGSGILAKNRDF